MSNINQLVMESIRSPLGEHRFIVESLDECDYYMIELAKPELDEGEWAVARVEKHKERRL